MHSLYSRLNALFAFVCFVLSVVIALNIISTFWLVPNPKVSLKFNRLRSLAPLRGNEVISVYFDLDADLRSVFHWNTRHLYVSVVVSYATAKNVFFLYTEANQNLFFS
eukprot:TRINITY_DN987_c0_g1_i3.p1 TRINITY_DN987_c0_g1~~TRINITY_DN987_c0_g1_i3.p1  ORF type:complete len:108 (-),score=0.27 TRINITY_DN987_c0_g1_i3:418-741(-)